MTAIVLFSVAMTAVGAATCLTMLAITATRAGAEPATASTFAKVGIGCPAADTLSDAATETVLPDRRGSDWQITTLNSLSDVESFLDYLENCRVTEREMHVLSNNAFAIRWRKAA